MNDTVTRGISVLTMNGKKKKYTVLFPSST